MKLTKPEYNENVTDVDALEKLRIQQEGETERNLVLQQELTKRTKIEGEQKTKQGDNYMYRIIWSFILSSVVLIGVTWATWGAVTDYIVVLRNRTELQLKAATPCPVCPAPVACPQVTCQPVPVK